MSAIARFFGHTVSSDAFDIRLGQAVCNVSGAVMLVVSMWKLTRLELSEVQLYFGLLLSLCVPMLLFIVGLLLPMAITARKQASATTMT